MMGKAKSPWGFNELMAVAAFRYCIGRHTYFVSACADWLIEHWSEFDESVKTIVQRELEEAFATEPEYGIQRLGDDCDRAQWERVRSLWKAE